MEVSRSPAISPRCGDIYDVILDPVVGSEIGKRRPAVIVSNDVNNRYSRTVTVVPITSRPASRSYPFEAALPRGEAGLSRESRAKCNQIRTLDKGRLLAFRGRLSTQYMMQVQRAIKVHLNLL